MKKLLYLTIGFLTVVAVLTQIGSIYISNISMVDSISATDIENRIKRTKEANVELESQALTYETYHAIASRAAVLGFKENTQFVSVYDPTQVAFK